MTSAVGRVLLSAVCLLLVVQCLPRAASAVDVGYYFDASNELIDLPYPGTEFYGEVDLTLLALNNLQVDVNAYRSPGEYDYLGNYITSPLVAGVNFGIQKFGINSTLVVTQEDYDAFVALYDLGIPIDWSCTFSATVSEFGKFEFTYTGTGHSQRDPLIIVISPRSGAEIPPEFEIDSVFDFVEKNSNGYYFAMHVVDFSTDPSYWEEGCSDVNSAFFGVSTETYVVPEPSILLLLLLSLAAVLPRLKRR